MTVHKIRVALLASSLSSFFVPAASIADSLSIGKLSSNECEWDGSSQEHWQAGHPRAEQVSPNGNECLIGVPDPEKKFALVRLNGKLIRLIPSTAEGSPPTSFISEDKKTQATLVVSKTIDGCEKSSGDSCCGVLLYGTLSVKHGNDTVKIKVHNYQGG